MTDTVRQGVAVAAGSALGAVLRLATMSAATWIFGEGYPVGTLLANCLGCFAVGLYATLTEPGGTVSASLARRQFVLTGLCGGYTTLSIFSVETLALFQSGVTGLAWLNVSSSVALWMTAVWLGHRLARA